MQVALVTAAAFLAGGVAAASAPAAWNVPRRQASARNPRVLAGPVGQPTGWKSAFIAVAGAITGAAIAARIGWHPALAGMLTAAVAGIWLAVVDLRVNRLPATAVVAVTTVVAALLAVAACIDGDVKPLAAATCGAAGLWLIYRLNQAIIGGMGAGDVRLAGLLGAVGGWVGWRGWVMATMLPFAVFAAYGGLLILIKRRRKGQTEPFGPAMMFGMITSIIVFG